MFTAEQAAAVASSFEKNVPFLQRHILGSPGHVYGVQAAASICFCLTDMPFFLNVCVCQKNSWYSSISNNTCPYVVDIRIPESHLRLNRWPQAVFCWTRHAFFQKCPIGLKTDNICQYLFNICQQLSIFVDVKYCVRCLLYALKGARNELAECNQCSTQNKLKLYRHSCRS